MNKLCYLVFLIICSCKEADPKISLFRSYELPILEVVSEKYYTNNASSSPFFTLLNFERKYSNLLLRFEYQVYKDGVAINEWLSAGQDTTFSMIYSSAGDGEYVGKIRMVNVYGNIRQLEDVKWFVDTVPPYPQFSSIEPTDVNSSHIFPTLCASCDSSTRVTANLMSISGNILQTKTVNLGENIQFLNLPTLRYFQVYLYYIDRANNTSTPVITTTTTCTTGQQINGECLY